MKNNKKAIVLDMDETLESGTYLDNEAIMTLRSHIDELIIKLKEAKKHGIDIILCTTARNQWVERFLALKPELRSVFDKLFTRDNENEWKNYSKELNPLEYEAKQQDEWSFQNIKPVTTFGYDSILFIDDNRREKDALQKLFEMFGEKLEKDVTYYSGMRFKISMYDIYGMLQYKNLAKNNPEFAELFKQYIELEREEPGCNIMCLVIDSYINKEFESGLKLVDEEYKEKYSVYHDKKSSLNHDLNDMARDCADEIDEEELIEYFSTDKSYPYEGIEIEKDRREILAEQVEEAKKLESKLDEAEKLKSDYENKLSKGKSHK